MALAPFWDRSGGLLQLDLGRDDLDDLVLRDGVDRVQRAGVRRQRADVLADERTSFRGAQARLPEVRHRLWLALDSLQDLEVLRVLGRLGRGLVAERALHDNI